MANIKSHEAILAAATLVMTALTTVFATLYWMKTGEADVMARELTAAKSSSRSAWQKVYDLQEQQEDAATARENQLQVELWQAKQKLEQCKR